VAKKPLILPLRFGKDLALQASCKENARMEATQMFILPSSEVLLLGVAVVLVLGSLQSFISGTSLHIPRFSSLDGIVDLRAPDHHPSLIANLENRVQRVSARRIAHDRRTRTPVAWVTAILAILVFLTLMLMMGIAVSV
jgi:hypothetical protein